MKQLLRASAGSVHLLLLVALSGGLTGIFSRNAQASEHDAGKIRPISARIMWTREREAEPGHFGDVVVTLSNNKTQMWTSSGGCALAKVSRTGLVGWVHGSAFHRTQGLMDHELVLAKRKHIIRRIDVEYPFINAWDFADGDSAVVIRYGAAHGPGRIGKFRINSGKLLGECSSIEAFDAVPLWAKPFMEGQ